MVTITLDDIQRDLAGYLHRVRAGETLLVLEADQPLAEIKPFREFAAGAGEPRPFGLCAGEFVVPDDFDDPLPEDILQEFRAATGVAMRLLLDTHIFLWFVSGDKRLVVALREAIRDPQNEVFLSVVSLWEMIIKHHLGHLSLPQAAELYVPTQRRRLRIGSLLVDEGSIIQVAKLPLLHRDPFDRLLIGQAIEHGLRLVTVDAAIRAYPTAPVL